MRSRFVLLLFLLATVLSASSVYASTEYLIITTDALAPAFEDLAIQKTARGYVTEIITLEDLASAAIPGRDVPEQMRYYIKSVYADGSLRFVLIGGDTAKIPIRYAFNDFYPAGGIAIPTDLYFAALDGDWDADGDNVFGEVGVDAVDLAPEVAVGRVPARTALEASQYVTKLGQYQDPVNDGHLDSALFLDEVLFPSAWQPGDVITLDGAEYGEQLRAIVQGGPRAITDTRLYENHLDYVGAAQLTELQSVAALNSGNHGLVLHTGWGNESALSMGLGGLDSADALGLTNGPHYFVMMATTYQAAAPDLDTVLEDLLRNPNGGAVAAVGMSRTAFPLSAQQSLLDINEQLFISGVSGLGEALELVLVAREAAAQDNNFSRYVQFSLTLLGDPELTVGRTEIALSSPRAISKRLQLRSVMPNPFNPQVTVQFDLLGELGASESVELSVFDVAGRCVRTLGNGVLEHGSHSVEWDGRDDAGATMSSGVYFIVVESQGERLATKATLVK